MKTDSEIKNNVLEELEWQPIVKEEQVSIQVKNGIVTISGIASNLAEKLAVENAVKKVKGVKALVENINVKHKENFSDTDIAKRVIFDLEWNASVPQEYINVKVEDGHVFLSGKVKWGYQKEAAKKSLEYIDGIKSITNNIKINEKVIPINIDENIKKAFERSANIDANNITVTINGDTAILTGKVNSIKEKDDALIAAYLAKGITNVKNELKVEYDAIYL